MVARKSRLTEQKSVHWTRMWDFDAIFTVPRIPSESEAYDILIFNENATSMSAVATVWKGYFVSRRPIKTLYSQVFPCLFLPPTFVRHLYRWLSHLPCSVSRVKRIKIANVWLTILNISYSLSTLREFDRPPLREPLL